VICSDLVLWRISQLSRLPPIRRRRDNLRVVFFKPRRRSTSYPNREARFGAKTIAGAGAFRPTDSDGNVYDLTGYSSLVSGSLGSYSPSISGGGLRFTGGGAGAPAGAVLRCTHANGTIDITIGSLVANTYSAASLTEIDAAYKVCSLGDRIELRGGDHNTTPLRAVINRSTSPSGTWTGTSILSDGNWVVITRDPGSTHTIGSLEINSAGGTNPRYARFDDLDFVSAFNADSNGIGTGPSATVSGQFAILNSSSFVALTNCRFRHTSPVTTATTGAFRAISSTFNTNLWIEGNTVDGAQIGFIGYATDSVIRKNTFDRILGDAIQVTNCNNLIVEGNVSKDKLYGQISLDITGITRGATTVFTVASATNVVVGQAIQCNSINGGLGTLLNGKAFSVTAKTSTTFTIAVNSSGEAAWDGLSGKVDVSVGHGDHLQFANAAADNLQDNVQIRGNVFCTGAGVGLFGGGQGIFANNGRVKNNWLVEGNIFVDVYQNGFAASDLTNSTVRSNTIVRLLGIYATNGGSQPAIALTGASSANNVLVDNIANAYTKTGVTTDTNNQTLTLVSNTDVPANATDVATYQAAFVSPVTSTGTDYDPTTAFATRTDAGSVFTGPIYPGATPYFDFDTLVYSDPRA
jgi:hypothetical protein